MFSSPQLIKYKHLLGISEYLVQEDGIWNWDESLIKASVNSNLEIVRLMIDGGANTHSKDTFKRTALMLAKSSFRNSETFC